MKNTEALLRELVDTWEPSFEAGQDLDDQDLIGWIGARIGEYRAALETAKVRYAVRCEVTVGEAVELAAAIVAQSVDGLDRSGWLLGKARDILRRVSSE